jgi:DNA-binding NarL/FixJ family response regulator
MARPTRPTRASSRLGDSRALANVVRQVGGGGNGHGDNGNGTPDSVAARRRMVAGFCRMLGQQVNGQASDGAAAPPNPAAAAAVAAAGLPRRLRQTLEHLLQGDGEKQIAHKLGLSQHTVHVYVKSLHKRFHVSSRAELLARFIRPGALPPPPPTRA